MTLTCCPICKTPPLPSFQPFCSERCKKIDLHRWLAGVYAIPTQDFPEDTGALSQEHEL
jgi:endogenous inhibitor of DNA gyrase (YacG/DUF329 family)